jgi:2-haloacid dehalogenase
VPPHLEAPAALEVLAARAAAILSNGHPDMLNAVVDHNGRASASAAGAERDPRLKPAPSVYRIAEESLGLPRTMLGFVSSNGWDAAGAKTFGFQVFDQPRRAAPRWSAWACGPTRRSRASQSLPALSPLGVSPPRRLFALLEMAAHHDRDQIPVMMSSGG